MQALAQLGLPECVERLIEAFACGWQPTPSAYAIGSAMRMGKGKVFLFDARAKARCHTCGSTVCGARRWDIYQDGSVYMLHPTLTVRCKNCPVSDYDVGIEEVGVCQTLSSQSTWETMWENTTGEMFSSYRRDEVRAYVIERLKGLSPGSSCA